MRISVFVFGEAICTVTITQCVLSLYLVTQEEIPECKWTSFGIVCENEVHRLETSACVLPRPNKVNTAEVAFRENGDQNINKADSLVPSLSKMTNVLFHYDRHYILSLRRHIEYCAMKFR